MQDIAFHAVAILGLAVMSAWMLRERYIGQDRRGRAALRKLERCSLADARDGQVVKLVGQLRPQEPFVVAPLTGRSCVAYAIVAEVYRQGRWQEILRTDHCPDFTLDTDGTQVMIRGRSAHLVPTETESFYSLRGPAVMTKLREFIMDAGHGAALEDSAVRDLRGWEGVLLDNRQVTVAGVLRLEPAPTVEPSGGALATGPAERAAETSAAYRELPRRRVLQAAGTSPLWVSDEPALFR